MKILYHHRIASKDGQYVHVEELTKALKAQGHELIMVGPSVVDKHEFGSEGGVVSKLKQHIPGAIYELLEFCYSFVAFFKLLAAAISHKPDFLYERYNLFMPAGVWLSKILGLPMLLEVNAPLYEERSKYDGIALSSLARWSERYVWSNAHKVLPVTEVLAGMVEAQGVARDKIVVIPNGIDKQKFDTQRGDDVIRKRLGLENRLVLGFTGFMREWHGLDRIVDLLAGDDNERHFLIVGDGPARQSIETRAKELGVEDRVTITGIVQREQVAGYVTAFDIALQPDVVDYASPLKLFEYMALGRAIVAPDKPNIREILVHEENALLFDPNDKDTFYGTINMLCKDDALREKISVGARNAIDEQKLTWENNAGKVIALAQNLVDKVKCATSP
jgi:glycosyltransferase involved in cell wall biosynthesis